ncbi:MAG: biopolymer transporter ExbD [Parvibaculum sp.]|uniref:ExbD/TolR family protein n=1 Tax=Parvibaculum sp. TaxID=2024848 RepID=UPI0027170A0A|nr:biopolymer transporter ExbD [Parvibaculum sp.]MDO8840169.1 biopolymer transporter ExbD [Parvibaculum sp.]
MTELDQDPPRRQFETLIPLINVVFLLLIFFLLAGTMTPADNVAVKLPIGALNDSERDMPATLLVEADGFVWLGDRPIDPKIVEQALKEYLADKGMERVAVKADAEAPAEALLLLMEALRKVGVQQVTIVTERGR